MVLFGWNQHIIKAYIQKPYSFPPVAVGYGFSCGSWKLRFLLLTKKKIDAELSEEDKNACIVLQFRRSAIDSVCVHSLRGSANKSLARPNSRCRRTESIVSLERGVCSCAELQVFSCYRGWKEACQATRTISTTPRHDLSSSPPAQGKAPK